MDKLAIWCRTGLTPTQQDAEPMWFGQWASASAMAWERAAKGG